MTKVAFHGCSFTQGDGFYKHERDIYLYPPLVCNYFNWEHDNFAIRGNSNKRIFHAAANSIHCEQYAMVFVQWSEVSRLWLSPEKNVWWFANNRSDVPYQSETISIDTETHSKFKKTLALLNGDYQNLKDLCEYCEILKDLARLHECKVIYINGMVDWIQDVDLYTDQSLWVNLEESMRKMQIDFAPVDNIHPGLKTHQIIADKIIEYLS